MSPGCSRTSAPGRAGVVEVDVREEQEVSEVAELDAARAERLAERGTQLVGPQSWSASPSSVSTR